MFARSLVVAAFLAVSVSADGHLSNETDMPMMHMTEEPMMEMNMTDMNMTGFCRPRVCDQRYCVFLHVVCLCSWWTIL